MRGRVRGRGGGEPAHLRGGGGERMNEPERPAAGRGRRAGEHGGVAGQPGGHPPDRPGAARPGQAKEAIDAARALLPLCPEEAVAPLKDALSQVQMLYVKATQTPAEQEERREAGARRGPREDLDAARLVIGVFGGTGFYRFLDEVEEVPVATPYGPPVGAGARGPRGGRRGRVHAPPRRRAHAAAAPDQLPRERLGDAARWGSRASSARPPAARSSPSSRPGRS